MTSKRTAVDGRQIRPTSWYFNRHVVKTKSGCWFWAAQSKPSSDNAPYFGNIRAQRFAYWQHEFGDAPYDFSASTVIRSNCGSQHCLNPEHLVAVPRADLVRGIKRGPNTNGIMMACQRGHDLSARTHNLKLDKSIRDYGCPICRAEKRHAKRVAQKLLKIKTPLVKTPA